MRRRLLWIVSEADALVALAIAVGAGVFGLLSVTPPSLATNAILVTLAVLALAVLRDRWRRMTDEAQVGTELLRASAKLDILIRQKESAGVVKLLNGREVAQAHAEARAHTDRWLFKGGTGTYIRAVTLPDCVARARDERRRLYVRLEILDPTDVASCDRYARFRRTVARTPDGTGEVWSCRRTREEAYATILAACWHQHRNILLSVDIALTERISIFRYDMSSDRLIITQDDPAVPSLLIERGSFLFESYAVELQASMDQARRVPIDSVRDLELSDEPTVTQVEDLFAALKLPLDPAEVSVPAIIDKALRAPNPYE